ncbi:MAG: hypothetical protein WC015_02920 [Methanoregula sp.]
MQTTSATRAGCGCPSLFGSTGTRAAIETDNLAIGCQRIETQNSAVNSATIFPKDSTPSRHTAKQSGHACAMHQTGFDRYRRRRAFVMREIPLYMLPAALRRGVAERGGKIYRAVIVRTHWNHYTIKIRCNTKKAVGHRSPLRCRDQSLATFTSGEGDADG